MALEIVTVTAHDPVTNDSKIAFQPTDGQWHAQR